MAAINGSFVPKHAQRSEIDLTGASKPGSINSIDCDKAD